jgi:hypothetical protein
MGAVATLASDLERERCARALRDHAAAGRLTVAELESRLDRAYTARYRSELRSVLRDLPRETGRRLLCAVERIDRFLLRLHATSFAAINGMLVALWAVTGQGAFWPAVVLVPWGFALAWHIGGSLFVRRMLARRRLGSWPTTTSTWTTSSGR